MISCCSDFLWSCDWNNNPASASYNGLFRNTLINTIIYHNSIKNSSPLNLFEWRCFFKNIGNLEPMFMLFCNMNRKKFMPISIMNRERYIPISIMNRNRFICITNRKNFMPIFIMNRKRFILVSRIGRSLCISQS